MGFFNKLVDDKAKEINPAHVMAFMLVVAVIGWGCWEAYHTGAMPSGDHLDGAAKLLGGSAAVNIAHKAEDIIARFKKPADPSPDPRQP
jgi:hypothetical protein